MLLFGRGAYGGIAEILGKIEKEALLNVAA
jgi:hypothetical protein